MKNQKNKSIALNLSYVLHERSNSDTVARYIRARDAELRRCTKAIREFGPLSDAELRNRLIILDESARSGATGGRGVQIVSVDIGAGELFPRLLHVAGIVKPEIPTFGCLLDGPTSIGDSAQTFFGAPAQLNTQASPAELHADALFATAVFRPGFESILLRVTALETDADCGDVNWQSATRLAEAVIREFPSQWWCERPLWQRPAEETLPEFASTETE